MFIINIFTVIIGLLVTFFFVYSERKQREKKELSIIKNGSTIELITQCNGSPNKFLQVNNNNIQISLKEKCIKDSNDSQCSLWKISTDDLNDNEPIKSGARVKLTSLFKDSDSTIQKHLVSKCSDSNPVRLQEKEFSSCNSKDEWCSFWFIERIDNSPDPLSSGTIITFKPANEDNDCLKQYLQSKTDNTVGLVDKSWYDILTYTDCNTWQINKVEK